jgi:flagellar assembly protein FliH
MSEDRLLHPGRILSADLAQDLPVWQIQPFAGGIESAREEQRKEAARRQALQREADAARAAQAAANAAAAAAAEAIPMVPQVTQEERDRVRAEAFDEGYAAGYDQGITAAVAEVQRFESLARNAATAFTDFEEQLAPQLLALAVAIARQVVRREIATEPGAILPVLREAFEQMTGSETGKQLFLNPADVELVRAHLSEDVGTGPWRIVEDARVEAGGCRIATRESEIDATVDTRWRRTVSALGDPSPWHDDLPAMEPPAYPAAIQAAPAAPVAPAPVPAAVGAVASQVASPTPTQGMGPAATATPGVPADTIAISTGAAPAPRPDTA